MLPVIKPVLTLVGMLLKARRTMPSITKQDRKMLKAVRQEHEEKLRYEYGYLTHHDSATRH